MQKQTFQRIDRMEARIARMEKFIICGLGAILLAVLSNHMQYYYYVLTKKYEYVHYDRETKKSGRSYLVGDKKLPSVTTILNASKDTSWLKKWQEKVGIEEAERIKNEASLIGSEMHKYLEYYVQDKRYESTTNEGQQARKMALEIVKRGFEPITEIWGTEVSLHHTDKYAGATDLVCLYKGRPVIVDFKQTNKPCQ